MVNPIRIHTPYVVIAGLMIWLAMLPSFALAQTPSFYIEVRPKAGTVDDTFNMSIVIEGGREKSPPLLTGGEDFKLSLIGPRNEVQIANGRINSRLTYSYTLMPKREGELLSPSAEIEIDGQKYAAPPVKLKVGPSAGFDPKSEPQDLFLKQTTDMASAYEGQQIVNSLDLYASIRILQPQMENLSYDDFWSKQIGEDNDHFRRMIDGTNYNVLRIKRAIFPIKSGSLILPARKIHTKALATSRRRSTFDDMDPFGGGFFQGFFDTATYEDRTATSNPLTVLVKPLPPAPPGMGFWGSLQAPVGNTSLQASLSEEPIRAGEGKTLTVEVLSTGNLSALNKVPIQLPASVRVYPDSPEVSFFEENERLVTRKVFRISIVPTEAGHFTIPPLRLGYFDLAGESWKFADTRRFSFDVSAASGNALGSSGAPIVQPGTTTPSISLTPAVQASPEPAYEEESALEQISNRISTGLALLVIASMLALGFITSTMLRLKRDRAEARKPLRRVESAEDIETLDAAVQDAIVRHYEAKASTRGESLKAVLRRKIPDPALQYPLLNLLEALESAKFGPPAVRRADLSALKKKSVEVLRNLTGC